VICRLNETFLQNVQLLRLLISLMAAEKRRTIFYLIIKIVSFVNTSVDLCQNTTRAIFNRFQDPKLTFDPAAPRLFVPLPPHLKIDELDIINS
jgi:hypothetical protein